MIDWALGLGLGGMHTFSPAACNVCKWVYGCLIYHKSLLGLVIVDGEWKILMWTLLACERNLYILLLMCVYLLHIAKYLQV